MEPAPAPSPAPEPRAEVTSAPLGACDLAEELPVVLGQYRETSAALVRDAPSSVTLFRLTAESTLRFWATGGPYPNLSGRFTQTLVRVIRGCPGEPESTVVASGETVAVDLPAGNYVVAVSPTLSNATRHVDPLPGALAYRMAAASDTQCPDELAMRRLDDWMGESVPQRHEVGDLNGDARADVAIDYRAASNQFATRVLVADDYPRCLRTVLDAEVTLKLDGGASGGWKHLRTTSWAPSPSGIIEDLWVVHRTVYDPALGHYVEGKRLGCSDGPSPDAKSVRCRDPRAAP